jgi:hydroxyacyl-ACP dehydratase HTD2-like protein with hotdog domain
MAEQIYFEDVNEGDEIPSLSLEIERVQMFFFSAATYNGHRIHYDQSWAQGVEGYQDILVHGPLQVALLARAITDWVGGRGRLVNYAVQNRATAFPGEQLRFKGTVTGKRQEGETCLVELKVHGEKGSGQILMPGTATVRLPRRGR